MFLAVIEWSPDITPTVLLSHHRSDLLSEIARHIHAHDLDLPINPLTSDDLAHPDTVAAWLERLHEATTEPWWTVYATTCCLPNTGALAALPNDAAAACGATI